MTEINENSTIKEFMGWFVLQHNGYWLPSELDHIIDCLEGYSLAKQTSEEYFILKNAVLSLKNFKTLLAAIKQYSNWKYK